MENDIHVHMIYVYFGVRLVSLYVATQAWKWLPT